MLLLARALLYSPIIVSRTILARSIVSHPPGPNFRDRRHREWRPSPLTWGGKNLYFIFETIFVHTYQKSIRTSTESSQAIDTEKQKTERKKLSRSSKLLSCLLVIDCRLRMEKNCVCFRIELHLVLSNKKKNSQRQNSFNSGTGTASVLLRLNVCMYIYAVHISQRSKRAQHTPH